MTIEDLVRAAQERQAERAVPADRIRAALPARIARHRRRNRLGTAAVVTAVAVAAVMPAVVLRGDDTGRPDRPVAAVPSTTARADPATTALPAAPSMPAKLMLRLQPGWVPAGLAEHRRGAYLGHPDDATGPTLSRVWKPRAGPGDSRGGPELTLSLFSATSPANGVDSSGRRVDVNGRTGYYTPAGGDQKSSVTWSQAGTTLLLSANRLDIAEQDLLRMARSLRPDPGFYTTPVRPGRLPAGWTTTDVIISGPSPDSWRAELRAAPSSPGTPPTGKDRSRSPAEGVTVIVGPTTEAPAGGKAMTVGGRPARQPVRADAAGRDLTYLVVELGGGRLMTLIGEGERLDVPALTTVAEEVEIAPRGMDWIGS